MTWLAGPCDADAQAGVRDRLLLAVWCREIRHGRRNRIGRGAEETRPAEQRSLEVEARPRYVARGHFDTREGGAVPQPPPHRRPKPAQTLSPPPPPPQQKPERP